MRWAVPKQALTLAKLRADHPSWKWSTERHGMAWVYVGSKGSRTVRVYAVSVLRDEDDFETQWRVEEEAEVGPYSAWWPHG
jgi:hypothetical protein